MSGRVHRLLCAANSPADALEVIVVLSQIKATPLADNDYKRLIQDIRPRFTRDDIGDADLEGFLDTSSELASNDRLDTIVFLGEQITFFRDQQNLAPLPILPQLLPVAQVNSPSEQLGDIPQVGSSISSDSQPPANEEFDGEDDGAPVIDTMDLVQNRVNGFDGNGNHNDNDDETG